MPSHRPFLYSYAGVAGLCCAGALLLLSGALSAAENAVHQKPYGISLQISNEVGAELKLEVRQAPLGRVLKEIASKTGARIHYSVLPEAAVTATCVGATVRHIMDCLVAKQVGLVANRPEQGKPAEFWLLGSSVGSCQAVTIEPTAPQIQAATNQQPEPTPEAPKLTRREQSDALLGQLKNAKTPAERTEVLTNLATGGIIDDPNVRKALEDAALDTDANTRAQAISTLANLDKEGSNELLASALHDSDASVRMMAVDQAGEDIVVSNRHSLTTMLESAITRLQSLRKLNAGQKEPLIKWRRGKGNKPDFH